MPRGAPDWGLWGPAQASGLMDDEGELAARLGSPVRWDRRGDVLYQTSFENGLEGWVTDGVGAGTSVDLYTGIALTGAYSIRLIKGDGDGGISGIHRFIAPLVISKYGLEVGFTVTEFLRYFTISLTIDLNTVPYMGRVRYDPGATALQYSDINGIWQPIDPAFTLLPIVGLFYKVKLIIDATDLTYTRVLINDLDYPFPPGVALDATSLAAPDYLRVDILASGPGDDRPPIYIDDVVVTQAEYWA